MLESKDVKDGIGFQNVQHSAAGPNHSGSRVAAGGIRGQYDTRLHSLSVRIPTHSSLKDPRARGQFFSFLASLCPGLVEDYEALSGGAVFGLITNGAKSGAFLKVETERLNNAVEAEATRAGRVRDFQQRRIVFWNLEPLKVCCGREP
ncbi:MAG: hypothetical protein L0177_11670 [Chloroflexi bacterium]|nr:hypothetical protein [Chloroflexota bacterium]